MTHALARAVAPTGHVFSFEFHAVRTRKAKAEVAEHGLASVATVTLRDIEGLVSASLWYRGAPPTKQTLPISRLRGPRALRDGLNRDA